MQRTLHPRLRRSLVAVAALAAPLVAFGASPAAAFPTASLTITGHGWGHGIGMGQWGALGYAVGQDGGLGPQTASWIVDHYYAPATLTTISGPQDAQDVTIAMTENNGNNVIVAADDGSGMTVPGGQPPGVTARVTGVYFSEDLSDPDHWNTDYTTTPVSPTQSPCNGPWTPDPVAQNLTSAAATTAPVSGGVSTLCVAGGSVTAHGSWTPILNSAGAERTVNTLGLEQYVADTVPGESPSSWGSLGTTGPGGYPWGLQQLMAQAIAVRSYVLANPNSYGGYADTCDLTCQTYRGTQYEAANTNLAAQLTAGQVMEMPGGAIATTEYSASTGGFTSGSPFTPVVDAGDSVCLSTYVCNPNHDWTASVPVSTIDSTWPQLGTLSSVAITQRNGGGADVDYGGRVTTIVLDGTSGNVTLSGPEFTDALGLKSDYFVIAGASDVGGGPSGGIDGYWLTAADGGVFSFGSATFYGSMGGIPLNAPVVGMAATDDDKGYWQVASDGGIFSFGDAKFYGSMGGRPLNQPVLAMASDPATGGYWEVASDGGMFSFDAPFYGSMGGQHLNQPIVGMAVKPGGGGYWLVASDGGIFSYGSARFFGSTGAMTLDQPIVGMAPTPDGGGYWLVAADGGIFSFGDATFYGSAAGTAGGSGTVGLVATATGKGYLIVTGSGLTIPEGDAPQLGNLSTALSSYGGHVVAAAAVPG